MTEIERKALALVNDVSDGFHDVASIYDIHTAKALRSALCRAIEQHEAFRQEVSDAITEYFGGPKYVPSEPLARFIITKPDPLVEAVKEASNPDYDCASPEAYAEVLRAALAARGLKIVEDK